MAFNPFHSFRKYRKAMFAILAIVCMFTFVLSSGLGGRNDILNVLPEWLGGGGSKYPVVARIDGKRIDELTISDTRVRRKMANDYMSAMFDEAARQCAARPLEISRSINWQPISRALAPILSPVCGRGERSFRRRLKRRVRPPTRP